MTFGEARSLGCPFGVAISIPFGLAPLGLSALIVADLRGGGTSRSALASFRPSPLRAASEDMPHARQRFRRAAINSEAEAEPHSMPCV